MTMLPKSTIEQWGVLRAVVEEGGFAPAAERLHRSQSSISYAVARLRDAVGVELLEHRGRRAFLTEAGAALLAEVTPLIEELNRIERRGRGIAQGEAVRIRLLVDTLFPKKRLFRAIAQIMHLYPDAELQLLETVRQTVDDVPADSYDLAILTIEPEATDVDRIADIRLIAVVSSTHPLLASRRPVTKAALARYPFAEIRGYDSVEEKPSMPGRSWRMNTVESAIDATRCGLCYGWLPCHLIQTELQDGTLQPLPLASGRVRHVPLGLYRSGMLPGQDAAMTELARLLTMPVEDECLDERW
ncbi:LysR family transcriptional regulator [Aeromonas sp. MdU4]|uniref:LysR family transcriptional regulator n=1 Tax=Aeromonas sp. MdU4 TaxID=3342819 RepID=UPI0035BAAE85